MLPVALPSLALPLPARNALLMLAWMLACGLMLPSLAGAQTQPTALSGTAVAAQHPQSGTTPGEDAPTLEAPAPGPERAQCLQECALASGQCNSEVRQARQECSRNAANAGRDPMSMRNDDYAYFCSYFRQPGRCAHGNCQQRFNGHLALCLNVMQKNIAAMRHDCFRNERDAQRICRSELRACEATCPQ